MTDLERQFENILVMGKSGAGKQPRIDVLVREFDLKQLSTGDIFRHYLSLIPRFGLMLTVDDLRDTNEGRLLADEAIINMLAPHSTSEEERVQLLLAAKAKFYVDSGLFVPDELVNDLVDDTFSKMGYRGAVLDGYPRTVGQARHLMRALEREGSRIDLVVLVDNEDKAIVARAMGRRICPKCKRVFHLVHKPPADGRSCDDCGVELVQRSDDTEEKIWSRLREFHTKVEPTIDYLESLGVPVAVVPGDLPEFTEEAVRESVLSAIDLVL